MLKNAIYLGLAAFLFAGTALGDITVEITKGGVARTPVAVVPKLLDARPTLAQPQRLDAQEISDENR